MNFARLQIQKCISHCGSLNHLKVIQQPLQNAIILPRFLSTSTIRDCNGKPGAKFITAPIAEKDVDENLSIFQKIVHKIPFLNPKQHKLGVCGYLLYESVADKVNYAEFFDEYLLPDTFYSWFVITELHVWMLMVRCMAEGEDGRMVRNSLVQAMWSDVSLRAKKLGAHNPSGVRMQIQELSEQFQAALIAYDEGLLGDDKILAGALWRRLYSQNQADAEHLDSLVKYVRKHIKLLDHVSSKQLLSEKKINWESAAH